MWTATSEYKYSAPLFIFYFIFHQSQFDMYLLNFFIQNNQSLK